MSPDREHGEEQTKGEKNENRLPSGQQADEDEAQSQGGHHRPQTRELVVLNCPLSFLFHAHV